ncbi:hypothetical protein IK5_05818 [Bacillus cereus VD154]|uniref:Uncharacterized protein n=1 Tax=Bacillus cereus VD154 TaxID=1053238 RepID=A0A9W5KRF8_BACCE|nr:hypothetical protein IK5_05818 [Bacillus cereus VD154]
MKPQIRLQLILRGLLIYLISNKMSFMEKKGGGMIFFLSDCIYFVKYRSLYSCFGRNSRDCKETNANCKYKSIIGHVLFLFGKPSVFVHFMGTTRYFLTNLVDFNCRNYDYPIKKKLVCTVRANDK